MKLWETEKFTLNLRTGELMRGLSNLYIRGENFEHATKRLIESNIEYLRLTGNWFLNESSLPKADGLQNNTPIVNKDEKDEEDGNYSPNGFYGFNFDQDEDDEDDDDDDDMEEFRPYKKPKEFIGYSEKDWNEFLEFKEEFLNSMDLDQTLDWLTTLERPQVNDVWKTCLEHKLDEKVKVVEGYLKYRYGKKD